MRRAGALFAALAVSLLSQPLGAQGRPVLIGADYAEPTTRYAHGVLGDAVEWGALTLTADRCPDCARPDPLRVTIRLPETRVFEDLAPRLVGLAPDRPDMALVVESDLTLGARLALYAPSGLVAATPFIGQANRWLAPLGAADLDGDGRLEVAYVDRPHLAKTLRIWRLEGDRLTEVAAMPGLSNHRIGWDYIEGGLRDCGQGPEMILASGDWTTVQALRFDGALTARSLGAYSPAAIRAAMACE